MKRFVRLLTQLPLATTGGAFLGVLIALVGAVLSTMPLQETTHPLAIFAIAPLPAALGVWIDWARLWRPSPRTRFWSFAVLLITGIAAVEVAFSATGVDAALAASAFPFVAGVVVLLGSHGLVFLTRRGIGLAGFDLACGTVRRDESERIVVQTPKGVLEVARSATQDLGSNRSIDLSVGSNIAVLARIQESVAGADPFRTERRTQARTVLGVSSSPSNLARTVRARARAWTLYLLLLAAAGSAFAAAASYQPERDCQVRSFLTKTF